MSANSVNAASVRSRALKASRDAVPEVLRGQPWKSFERYVSVPQTEFDLLPLHFLPREQTFLRDRVSWRQLCSLCVASKLLYAQIRWLDSFVDDQRGLSDPHELHGINNALGQVIHTTFDDALKEHAFGFFATLSSLYSSYSLSSALDSHAPATLEKQISVESYASHAKARTAPMRAPVDAVMIAIGAEEETINTAREAFENCMVAVQFYDDCLDVEEDFAEQRGSWTVRRIFSDGNQSSIEESSKASAPTADDFFARALLNGHLEESLTISLQFFENSRKISEKLFPGWAEIQSKLIQRIQSLKKEYSELVAYHNQ